MMGQPEMSIIIPTKNEEEGIAKVIVSIPEKIREISEIIVVDASTDLTPKIARALGANVIKVRKSGKGYAMKVGVKRARGNIIVFLDGDGTDPPSYIPKLLKKLEKGYDIVLGARSLKKFQTDDKLYRVIFKLYTPVVISAFKLVGWPLKGDPLAGFRMMKKETFNKMNLKYDDFRIETEMNLKALEMNLRLGEVSIPHLKRAGGLLKSKLVRDINQWFAVFDLVIEHAKEKKIKNELKKLRSRII